MEDIIRLGKKKYCQGEPIATLRLPGSLHCAAVESGQCHVNGFYFCLIMLFAGKPRVSMRGCSAAVSQCLTGGFVLSLSGCSHWREGGKGWGRVGLGVQGGANSELNEPPGSLGVVRQPPTFPTRVLPPSLGLPLPCRSLALSLFLALSLTKLDRRPTGPDPRTGSSQLAYQELPQGSPDTVIEGEQRKQGPQKTELWPFWEAFCFLCGHMLCVFM